MNAAVPLLARLTAGATLAFAPMVAEAAAQPPVRVMIVADFHMANPGADQHNVKVDDMLAPRRQAEIARVTDALARFRPTLVAAEWPAEVVAERYPKYLAGALPPSRNEVVQLAFRLAKATGARMLGADVEGDFPYEPVESLAKARGQSALLAQTQAGIEDLTRRQERLLGEKGVAATLRYLNDPARLGGDNAFYRTMLRVGEGDNQPGAELLAAWYRRNLRICANLVQATRPGDRMVVFYGAGHAFLLRQCVQETPGLRLVEANAWLPR